LPTRSALEAGPGWSPLIEAGQLATCAVIDLHLLSLVDDPGELDEIRQLRAAAFAWLTTEDADLRRAVEVQRLLATNGYHPVAWAALVVAAVAERHQVAVLHCAGVFDRIAEVTATCPIAWYLRAVIPTAKDVYAGVRHPRRESQLLAGLCLVDATGWVDIEMPAGPAAFVTAFDKGGFDSLAVDWDDPNARPYPGHGWR